MLLQMQHEKTSDRLRQEIENRDDLLQRYVLHSYPVSLMHFISFLLNLAVYV